MTENNSTAQQIAQILLDIKAVKVSIDPPFTWTSGMLSPIYCDNRMLISHPGPRQKVLDAFKQVIKEKELKVDVIGGTATAAIPWAAFLAHEMGLPMVYIRPEKKAHGAGKQIEGDLEEGKHVLIVEDLISTGGSSIASAEAVREEGKCTVTDVLAIVTYELSKAQVGFDEAKLNLHTLTSYTELVALAVERGVINLAMQKQVLEFKEDPPAWGKKMGFE